MLSWNLPTPSCYLFHWWSVLFLFPFKLFPKYVVIRIIEMFMVMYRNCLEVEFLGCILLSPLYQHNYGLYSHVPHPIPYLHGHCGCSHLQAIHVRYSYVFEEHIHFLNSSYWGRTIRGMLSVSHPVSYRLAVSILLLNYCLHSLLNPIILFQPPSLFSSPSLSIISPSNPHPISIHFSPSIPSSLFFFDHPHHLLFQASKQGFQYQRLLLQKIQSRWKLHHQQITQRWNRLSLLPNELTSILDECDLTLRMTTKDQLYDKEQPSLLVHEEIIICTTLRSSGSIMPVDFVEDKAIIDCDEDPSGWFDSYSEGMTMIWWLTAIYPHL